MSTTVTTTTLESTKYQLSEIKNGFGAEIRGLDFTNGVNDDDYRVLLDAVTKVSYNEHTGLDDRRKADS